MCFWSKHKKVEGYSSWIPPSLQLSCWLWWEIWFSSSLFELFWVSLSPSCPYFRLTELNAVAADQLAKIDKNKLGSQREIFTRSPIPFFVDTTYTVYVTNLSKFSSSFILLLYFQKLGKFGNIGIQHLRGLVKTIENRILN